VTDLPVDPLTAHTAAYPDRAAIIDGDSVVSYAELNAEVNRLVNGLAGLGVGAGERAAWCGPNSRSVLAFMHACRKLGLMALPVPYRFTAAETRHLLADSGAVMVLVDSEHAPVVTGLAATLPNLRHVVAFGPAQRDVPGPKIRYWDDVTAGADETEPPPPSDYGAAMMYTSGTTGRPKGAVRTRSDRALLATMLRELNFGAREVHILSGPLYHAGPNAFALLTHLTGGTIVMLRHFDPAEWVRLVSTHRVTSTFAAPTHLKRIVSLPDATLAAADFSSLRTLIANAAPVPYALKQEVIAKLGEGFLFEVYGSTELGIDTILRPEDQLRKPGSCGRPYGGIEVMIAGTDGKPMPVGMAGEMYVRTPLAIDGYHGDSEHLAELPADDGSGDAAGTDDLTWKSVGDIASVDEDGYVYIQDRRIDMVITGGVNVYPAEVEAVLHSHPDVLDAAVFGVPDPEWGERVHAVVQARPGHEIDVGDLEAHAGRQLAGFKRPRSWEVRAELPRTDSGKLLKRVLRDEYRDTGAAALPN